MPRSEPPAGSRFPTRRQLLALLPMLVAGCGAAPPRPLAVGISMFPTGDLAVMARDAGFFREAGVDVRLVEFEDLSDAQRAFEQGKLDGLGTTLVELLVTRSSGQRNLRAMRVTAVSEGADLLLAPKAVHSIAELRGRRVGVEIASLGHYVLARALHKAGLDLSDVTPVTMAQHAMQDALLAGEVSAVVAYPPQAIALGADPRWHVLFTSREMPQEVVHVYAFDARTIAERPVELQAFFGAVDRAHDQLSADPLASCRTMAARGHVAADRYCASLREGLRWVPPSDQVRYFGPSRGLQASVNLVQRELAHHRMIDDLPGLADCLEPMQP